MVCLRLIESYERANDIDLFGPGRLEKFDPKTKLQEKTMALYKNLPRYEAREIDLQKFEVELFVNNKLIGKQVDTSKKRAQKKLAQNSLDTKSYIIKKESDNASYPTPE